MWARRRDVESARSRLRHRAQAGSSWVGCRRSSVEEGRAVRRPVGEGHLVAQVQFGAALAARLARPVGKGLAWPPAGERPFLTVARTTRPPAWIVTAATWVPAAPAAKDARLLPPNGAMLPWLICPGGGDAAGPELPPTPVSTSSTCAEPRAPLLFTSAQRTPGHDQVEPLRGQVRLESRLARGRHAVADAHCQRMLAVLAAAGIEQAVAGDPNQPGPSLPGSPGGHVDASPRRQECLGDSISACEGWTRRCAKRSTSQQTPANIALNRSSRCPCSVLTSLPVQHQAKCVAQTRLLTTDNARSPQCPSPRRGGRRRCGGRQGCVSTKQVLAPYLHVVHRQQPPRHDCNLGPIKSTRRPGRTGRSPASLRRQRIEKLA